MEIFVGLCGFNFNLGHNGNRVRLGIKRYRASYRQECSLACDKNDYSTRYFGYRAIDCPLGPKT
jgi:hypothetical protein